MNMHTASKPGQTFTFKARDASGTAKTGTMSAPDANAVIVELRAQGLFPVSVEAASGTAKHRDRPLKNGAVLKKKQAADLIERLARLTERQIPLESALTIVADGGDKAVSTAAKALRKEVREGTMLSRALSQSTGITDPAILAIIEGGEASGLMPQALASSAQILRARLAFSRKIVTGLTYPSLLLVIALLSLGLIMVMIIPQFRPLVADRFDLVPPLGRAVFFVSDFLAQVWRLVLIGAVITAALAVFAARRGILSGILRDIVSRIPWLNGYVLRNQTMLVFQVLGTLLGREITLSEALRVVHGSVDDPKLARKIAAIRTHLSNGGALSDGLIEHKLVSREGCEMVRIGEEAGQLPAMIQRTAEDLRDAIERDLERLLLIFQPVLIVFVGSIIGVSLYALFSAIVSVNAISF